MKQQLPCLVRCQQLHVICGMEQKQKRERCMKFGEETSLLIGSNLLIEPLGGSEFFASSFHQLTLGF